MKGRSNRRCVLCVCLGETSMQISQMIRAWEWIFGLACSPCSSRMPAAPVEKPRALAALSLTLPNVSPADRSSGMGLGLRGATILTLMMSRDWYSCWPEEVDSMSESSAEILGLDVWCFQVCVTAKRNSLQQRGPGLGSGKQCGRVLANGWYGPACGPGSLRVPRGGAPWAMAGHGRPRGFFIQQRRAAFAAADSSHGAKSGTNIRDGWPLIDAGNFGTQMLPEKRG